MNGIGNQVKKGSKQAARAIAKQIRDESLEIIREGNRQISGESSATENKNQNIAKKKEKDNLKPISDEEIRKRQIAEDRYMKGLEAEVFRLQKLRQQEIEEQRKKEEQEKTIQEAKEKESGMVEIRAPGNENRLRKKMKGIKGKITRKKSPDIGKRPSS